MPAFPVQISSLADATALAAVVTFLVSVLKPFVELLPFARVNAPTHDATMRLLNVLLNILIVFAVAASFGQLTGTTWIALVLQGLAQAAGSAALYTTTTRSGASIGDSTPVNWSKLFTAPRSQTSASTDQPSQPAPEATATTTAPAEVTPENAGVLP